MILGFRHTEDICGNHIHNVLDMVPRPTRSHIIYTVLINNPLGYLCGGKICVLEIMTSHSKSTINYILLVPEWFIM